MFKIAKSQPPWNVWSFSLRFQCPEGTYSDVPATPGLSAHSVCPGPLLPIENAFASELSERILLYSRSIEASPRPMSTYGILQVSRPIHCFLIVS